ncbi:MAG: hypothetical protein J6I73_08080 [Treponema sp.]|nr:hypothetical protein [Treponema sp.]
MHNIGAVHADSPCLSHIMTRISTQIIKSFLSIGKAFGVIFLCAFTGFMLVLPLWYTATTFPTAYTRAVLALLFAFAAYKIINAVKKFSWQRVLFVTLRIAIVVGGITLAIAFVCAGFRFAAIPVIILIPLIYVASSRFFEND